MLTQAECQELVQRTRRHRATTAQLIFVKSFLESTGHAELLYAEFAKPKKRTTAKSQALHDALWNGYYKLKTDAEDCANKLTERGQLLFAFPGTTVLQAVA